MRRGLAFLAAVVIIGGGIVGGVSILTDEPNEIRTTLEPAALTVSPGQTFTVGLTIENVDLEAVDLKGIGVEQSLLDGISLVQIDPGYREVNERNYPLIGEWTEYKVERTIFAGEKLSVILTFRADTVGQYSGDILARISSDVIGGVMASKARRAELEVVVQ